MFTLLPVAVKPAVRWTVCRTLQVASYLAAVLYFGALPGIAVAQVAPSVVGTPGLMADYYRGYFYEVPSFFSTNAPAIHDRPVEQLNFAEAENDNFAVGSIATYYKPGNPDEFSARFQGQINILTAGQYTFYLGSDDAAYLWLDNAAQSITCNKGDTFAFREATGTCTLTAGLHTLRVDYGEHGGSQGLVLQYSGPGMPKQLVPNGVFYNKLAAGMQPTLTQLEAAASQQQQVNVQWSTAAEENSTAFVVQKSTDGVVFHDLMRHASLGSVSEPHNYAVLDQHPATGWNYYRVQQLRSDRPAVYSPIKAVEVKAIPFTVTVYPVPNNGSFYVQYQPSNVTAAQLELLDMSGRLMYRQQLSTGGSTPQYIQPAQATGLYMLQLTTDAGKFRQKISLGN